MAKSAAKTVSTVAERRAQLRASKGGGRAGPSVKKTEIDLSKPEARKALTALYPRPENDTVLDATPVLERAALAYVEARDDEARAKKKKEAAGNVLCAAIQKNLGIVGDGWRAEWDMSKGNVDWTLLAKETGISDETIAKYRKPDTRGLDVRETAED